MADTKELTICPRPECGHQWKYKGRAWYITCPVCRKLFKNPKGPGNDTRESQGKE